MDYVGLLRCAGPMAVHYVGKVVAPVALPCLIGSASVFYLWNRLYGLALAGAVRKVASSGVADRGLTTSERER